jgi:pimeloyl-ACP methyl ester carboxylesterase
MSTSVASALTTAAPAAVLHAVSAGTGPAVVCLHSSGSASSQWRRLIEAEQARHRFIAFDLHGHGRSPAAPPGEYALRTESDAVWGTIARITGPVHLVGHSYGGAVALDLALRHPGRFASVAVFEPVLFGLLDPAGDEYRDVIGFGRAIVADARSGRLAEASQRFIDYWSGAGTWAAMAAEQQQRAAARIVTVAAHFDALFSDPVPFARLRSLRTPTLVMRGDRSPGATRAIADRLGTIAGVTSGLLSGAGHMGPITHAPSFNVRIVKHFGSVELRRAA